jgi:diguanylate cyclase (GGDEF)-like protein
MHGSYNLYLVALSLAVATLASYTSLELTAHIYLLKAAGAKRFFWLLGGAIAMGTGIWSMHFIGMLAFRMPIALGYDARITGYSLLIAVVTSGLALHVATGDGLDGRRLFFGGALLGLGVAAMHYTGMASMRMRPGISYRPGLFLASIGVAMAASCTALWISFRLRDDSQRQVLLKRCGAGLVMGLAIAGMHYLGMIAAVFDSRSTCGASDGVSASWLVLAVTGATLSILILTLIFSMLDTRFYLHAHRLNTSLQELNQRLLKMATEDALTGLPNRSSLIERIERVVARSQGGACGFSVLFMDLDAFKSINDSLGHSAGDRLLKVFSSHLAKATRAGDTVARLSGDEFVVLLEGLTLPTAVTPIAEAILQDMQQEFVIDGTPLRVTLSIGIVTYPQDGASVEELLKNADMAMYEAKQSGRNTYRYYDVEMSKAASRTLLIHHGLTIALEEKQMSLHFQPKLRGMKLDLAGAEALIRWQHPELGNISPMEFIPAAERTGQIVPIGNWVICEVCRHIRKWEQENLPSVKIAINLSLAQLRQPDFVKSTRSVIDAAGIAPERIMFEITETMAMQNAELVAEVIRQFQSAGFDFAIDDFGTGYSSLAYLQRFRVKQLKIDRFFIDGLDSSGGEGHAIVAAIIELAHSLKMMVVAEGVETEEQLAQLKRLKCDELQGFLLAKPMNSWNFEDFLRDQSNSIPTFMESALH